MVAYKTVIAPGEYYITPGVAVVSKLHWSLPRFKAELSLLTARAPGASLSPLPGYKKSIGFQIEEERTRLILNGYSSRACLFFGPPCQVWWGQHAWPWCGPLTRGFGEAWVQFPDAIISMQSDRVGLSLCLMGDRDIKLMSERKRGSSPGTTGKPKWPEDVQ